MFQNFYLALYQVAYPRRDRSKIYPLDFILLIVFLSTISGCSSWYEIEDNALASEKDLLAIYERLTGSRISCGIPSHNTINRIMGMLEPSNFEKAYRSCIANFLSITEEKHLCIDGKTMQGVKKLDFDSSSHTVSAFSPSGMASMAQFYIDHKSNEINAIKVLLEQIELKDTLISIDEIGTQTAIAEQIKEKGGKYLLGVKSNQKHTLQEVESCFCPLYKKYIQKTETTELAHGRIETRCYEMIPSPLTLEPNEILSRWTDLQSIVKVTRTGEFKKTGEKSQEVSYYISSEYEMMHLKMRLGIIGA